MGIKVNIDVMANTMTISGAKFSTRMTVQTHVTIGQVIDSAFNAETVAYRAYDETMKRSLCERVKATTK